MAGTGSQPRTAGQTPSAGRPAWPGLFTSWWPQCGQTSSQPHGAPSGVPGRTGREASLLPCSVRRSRRGPATFGAGNWPLCPEGRAGGRGTRQNRGTACTGARHGLPPTFFGTDPGGQHSARLRGFSPAPAAAVSHLYRGEWCSWSSLTCMVDDAGYADMAGDRDNHRWMSSHLTVITRPTGVEGAFRVPGEGGRERLSPCGPEVATPPAGQLSHQGRRDPREPTQVPGGLLRRLR